MTLATSSPSGAAKEGFRLSMLIYDTRFRAITIQVVVLILFLRIAFPIPRLRTLDPSFDACRKDSAHANASTPARKRA